MHDARYLISHYANQYVSVSQVGNSTQGQHSEKEPSMANVLTTGAWLSAPTRKPSFFARLLRSQIEARQRHADRLVEQYLAVHGNKFTDDPEEAIRSFERAIRMSPVDPRLYGTLTGIGQALIELRRFDEAIVVLKKALRQNPSNSGTYRCLASAFAHLGRDAEAHDAAARVLEIDPAFTISALIARVPKNSKLFIEGLRKAGLPE